MSLSRRERIVVIAAVAVIGAWLADNWVVSPLWAQYQADVHRAERLQQQVFRTEQLLRRRRPLAAQWRRRLEGGIGEAVSRAEGNLLNALERWAGQSALGISSVKPDREPAKDGLQVVRCRLTVNGRMAGLAQFCWYMEGASIPLRVEKMQLGAADAARDALTVQLQVSTVCLAEPPPQAAKEGPQR